MDTLARKTWKRWIGAGVGAAGLLLAVRGVDLGLLGEALARINPWAIALGTVVRLAIVGLMACRWALLFPQPPTWRRLVVSLLIGSLANAVSPLRIAGMLVRTHLIGVLHQQSRTAVMATVVVEKLLDSLAFLVLALAVFIWITPRGLAWPQVRITVVLPLSVLALLLFSFRRAPWLTAAFRPLQRLASAAVRGRVATQFGHALGVVITLRSVRVVALLCLWTIGIFGLSIAVNQIVMSGLQIHAPFSAAVVVLVALQLANRLTPVAPLGGLGVFQLVCTESLALFGVDRISGICYGILLHAVVVLPSALLGAAAVWSACWGAPCRIAQDLHSKHGEAAVLRDPPET